MYTLYVRNSIFIPDKKFSASGFHHFQALWQFIMGKLISAVANFE